MSRNVLHSLSRRLSPDAPLDQMLVQAGNQSLFVPPAPVTESQPISSPGGIQHLFQLPAVNPGKVPANAKALLQLKSGVVVSLPVGLPQHPVQAVQLVLIEKLRLLLHLKLYRFQPGDVRSGRGVFQFLDPPPVQFVFLCRLDVLLHGPAQLLHLPAGQTLFCLH